MTESEKAIINAYNSLQSVRATAKKTLVTHGIKLSKRFLLMGMYYLKHILRY